MQLEELMREVKNETIDQLPMVETSVFIGRIRSFEKRFAMPWFTFLEHHDHQQLKPTDDQQRLDFAEWYMLCQRFSDELTEGLTLRANAPPGEEYCANERGLSDQAFFICYTHTDVVGALTKRSAPTP